MLTYIKNKYRHFKIKKYDKYLRNKGFKYFKFESTEKKYLYMKILYKYFILREKYSLYKKPRLDYSTRNGNVYIQVKNKLTDDYLYSKIELEYSLEFSKYSGLKFVDKIKIRILDDESLKYTRIAVDQSEFSVSELYWIESKSDINYNIINDLLKGKVFDKSDVIDNPHKDDRNYKRYKKLSLSLKERKRQIDSMSESDDGYRNLVNEYNLCVRKWKAIKEKYNF